MKKALAINALFSSLSGVVLIIFQTRFAQLFGWITSTPFWITGIALLFFSLTIYYEMKKLNRMRIAWIIIQDLLWVLASVFLLILQPFVISKSGNLAIAVVAIIVLSMGVNQFVALRKTKA